MGVNCSDDKDIFKSLVDSKPNVEFIDNVCNNFVRGYIGMESSKCSNDLINLIRSFYGKKFIHILKFSVVGDCKGENSVSYFDNNQCVVKKSIYKLPEHQSSRVCIYVTDQHRFDGIHCWRVYAMNYDQGNIFYGVTQPPGISDDSADWNTRICAVSATSKCPMRSLNGVVEIAGSDQGLPMLAQRELFIDILLDIDRRELKICAFQGSKKKPSRSLCWCNVDLGGSGWMPIIYHIDNDKEAAFRMAKIPPTLYSKNVPIWKD